MSHFFTFCVTNFLNLLRIKRQTEEGPFGCCNIMKSGKLSLCSTTIFGGLCLLAVVSTSQAALPYTLGQAGSYAVLGLGGISSAHGQIEVYQSATIVNGNAGPDPYADRTHGVPATIH